MRSAWHHVPLGALSVALVALLQCGGETVRLGDGTTGMEVASTGGIAGQEGGQGGEGGSPDGVGGVGAGGAEDACQHAQVEANEVVWIGDTWVFIPGTQRTRLRELAQGAMVLALGEDYVNLGTPSQTLAQIWHTQYEAREASAIPVKVLLMDGGTWDTIQNSSDATVNAVVNTFSQFLAQVESDGTVEHIVYFLQPELPTIPRVADLRPGLQQACAESVVPCHFLDLQPIWMGREQEYTDPSGIQASQDGGTVIADAIWAIMQENCIAQ